MDQSSSVLFHNPMGIEWFRAEPTQQTSGRTTRSTHRTHFLRSSLQETQPPNSSELLPASLSGNPSSEDELIPIPSETPLPRTSHQLCPAPSSILDYLWSHPFYKRLMGPLKETSEIPSLQIAESLLNKTLLACCDGSFSPNANKGSHG
jgi:hypothetical protein